MNNRQFDAILHRRVEKETFTVNSKIEEALQKTLLNPEVVYEAKKAGRRGLALSLAASLVICVVALAVNNIKPNDDLAFTKQIASSVQIGTPTALPSDTTPYYDGGYSVIDHVYRTRCGVIYRNHRMQINYEVTNISSSQKNAVISPIWHDSHESFANKHYSASPAEPWSGMLAPQETVSGTFVIYMLDPTQQAGAFSAGISITDADTADRAGNEIDLNYTDLTEAGDECFSLQSSLGEQRFQMVGSDYEYLNNGMLYLRIEYRANDRDTLDALLAQRPNQTVFISFSRDNGNHNSKVIQEQIYQAKDGTWRLPYICMLSGVIATEQVTLCTSYNYEPSESMAAYCVDEERFRFVPGELANDTSAPNQPTATTVGNYVSLSFEPTYSAHRLDAKLSIQTKTDEPIFIRWQPALNTLDLTLASVNFHDIFAAGFSGTARAVWLNFGERDESLECGYVYQVYRISDGHELYQEDSYLVNTGTDSQVDVEYTSQQARIEQAYAAGKVIVVGSTLTLPEAQRSGDSRTGEALVDEAVERYLADGWLELAQQGSDNVSVTPTFLPSAATITTWPLQTVGGDGYTLRLMQADTLELNNPLEPWQTSAYVITDIQFESRDAMTKLDQTMPDLSFQLYLREGVPLISKQRLAGLPGLEWQGADSKWHRTFVNMAGNINQDQANADQWMVIPATPIAPSATTSAWTRYPEQALTIERNQSEIVLSTNSTLSILQDFSVDLSRWKAQYHVTLQNPYPVEQYVVWQPLPDAMLAQAKLVVPPCNGQLLDVLETVHDQALYYLFGSYTNPATMGFSITSYTLWAEKYTEHALFGSTEDGYTTQQANFAQAFSEGKLLFAADRLILPDSYEAKHPQTTPLAYYLDKGMLVQQKQESQSKDCTYPSIAGMTEAQGKPLSVKQFDGYTARVMTAQLLDSAPYVVVDLQFDNAESMQRLDEARPKMVYFLRQSDGSIYEGDKNTFALVDENWTRTVNGAVEYHRFYLYMSVGVPKGEQSTEGLQMVPFSNVIGDSYPEDAITLSF